MNILSREGSSVILMDKHGRIWLTRRKKLRHDNRRKKPCHTKKRSVFYFPIKQLI